jgi:hypothetical protein
LVAMMVAISALPQVEEGFRRPSKKYGKNMA